MRGAWYSQDGHRSILGAASEAHFILVVLILFLLKSEPVCAGPDPGNGVVAHSDEAVFNSTGLKPPPEGDILERTVLPL